MLTRNRAHSSVARSLHIRVRMNLLLVVSHARLRYGAHVTLLGLGGIGVVGRQNRGSCSDDRADSVIHGLALRLLNGALQGWAFGSDGRLGGGDWH